ncbi:glycosyltransferase family 2 protein [Burkholderia lata]|uniref:glycosyltransferase family 2 protein n=1 Tax=Burkholderia lata (strain ATCC 17760 / DSM 23089 / LMG 22485 / NCIMB 9086 / R18194 / 383) TaxID=482957 RepID=UPI00399C085D
MTLSKVSSLVGRITGGRNLGAMVRQGYAVYRREGFGGVKRKLTWMMAGAPGAIDPDDYANWISRHDRIDDAMREAIARRIGTFAKAPLISVVMPVYNPRPEWLAEAIESVQRQLYPHWELCIADDRSPDPAIRPLLERYAAQDSRIKVVFRETNGHISAASNSALGLVTGEWVALLDHDDLLPEHALYCVADTIERNPSTRLIYSDEDKIDERGRRRDPYFKCAWNPDLFHSHNMFSHLGVYQKALLDEVGGFRIGYEGSQDYDLALRCVERVDAAAIRHIPRVLYHWRIHSTSTSSGVEAKPYAAVVGEKSISEHFGRLHVAARAEYIGYGYRVRYALPAQPPLITLIIPTRNAVHLMRQCIGSILERTAYENYEILIVDNGSDDAEALLYFESLVEDPRIRVLRDARPFNYSALNNAAIASANGEFVCLLNNDIEVISPDWLSEMVGLALQPGVGAVGAKLLYPNDTVQHAGLVLGIQGVAGNAHKHVPRTTRGYFGRAGLVSGFSAVTAACLLVRKSVYLEVGGLDEANLAVAYNDVDFCLRIRQAGYRNVWTPFAELYHHESATRGPETDPANQLRFERETAHMTQRWGKMLVDDPCYSPNLTLDREDFSLAWPPRVAPLV